MPGEWQFLLRLLAATALAGMIGAERELSDQQAGFRTHALVGLGACLFAIISAFGFQAIASSGPSSAMRADVTRVVSQIVVGIGFLGGGAIVKYGTTIRGLTTAATLWITAAIGTAVGLGAWVLAAGATVLALISLAGLRPIRRLLRRHASETGELRIEMPLEANVTQLLSSLDELGVSLARTRIDERDGAHALRVRIRLPSSLSAAELTERLAADPRVDAVDWDGGGP